MSGPSGYWSVACGKDLVVNGALYDASMAGLVHGTWPMGCVTNNAWYPADAGAADGPIFGALLSSGLY